MDDDILKVRHAAHTKYFLIFLNSLPEYLAPQETTRVVLAFFSISGLDLLNTLNKINEKHRKIIIDWIYKLQTEDDEEFICGFQGSTFLNTNDVCETKMPYKWAHLASTYSALCCLLILGDDLSRIKKSGILKSIRTLQESNGCFTAAKQGTESDMRFVYCAACICYILDDWSGMDVEKTIDFIKRSICYDYGIAQGPSLESHGGPTFCALATLSLLNRMDCLSSAQIDGLKRWLIFRQVDGFQGRPNKPVDTCYSFWIGASLKLLNSLELVDFDKNYEFILSTQDRFGGFAKWALTDPDPLHTYLGLAGLSLMGRGNLNNVVPALNISERACNHLKSIHEKWRNQH